MDTPEKTFIWTPTTTENMFKLRFENEWLFKKKKQPWKEFRDILLQNGFPEEMTLDQIRKKWSYTYDCYRLAKRTKNKKWLYYKLFDKHFRKNKVLDKYESWNDEWRLILVKFIMQATNAESIIDWRLVENSLRIQDLPIDCCIQDLKELWHHLKVTFHRKYRLNLKKGAELTQWPQYEEILHYYETYEPDYLIELANDGTPQKVNNKKFSKRIKLEDGENVENEEFHWTKDITESFIQVRLQHEWLFRETKWAWNDLASIMCKEYGFPNYLTGRMICHKWSSTYSDYQKAKATGNTNWLYYNLFEAYLGEETANFDLMKNWKEEWVNRLIIIRTELEGKFGNTERTPHTAWREVEKQLRKDGLPLDHSLLDLSEMWMKLFRTFKWKRKFDKKGILNVKWPYYENMVRYMAVRQTHSRRQEKAVAIPDHTAADNDYEDDIVLYDLKKKINNNVKNEVVDNLCRACCKADGCIDLFDPVDENGLDLAAKLKVIAGVEIEKVDNYPKEICYNCLKELESAYNFRKKCQVADDKLRNMKVDAVKIETNMNEDSNELQIDEKLDNLFDDDHIDDLFKETKEIVKKTVKNSRNRKKYSYDYSRVCEICGKRTRNIRNHMDSHSTDKMYHCDQCGKKFKFKSGLVIHKAIHNPVPKKTCEVCGKAFHVIAQYRKHFIYHVNERKFSCESCGKAFHTKEILTVHMRTHTDERPFSCPECGKTFRTAGCVSRHRRIVHKKIGKS